MDGENSMDVETINEFERDKYGQTVRIDRYDKYRHHNGAYYAYMVRPIGDLDTSIPLGIRWGVLSGVFDADGEVLSKTPKTVSEFVIDVINLGNGFVIIPACALARPSIRQPKVTKDDLDDWVYFGINLWEDPMILLTSAERNEYLHQHGYQIVIDDDY